MAMTNAERQASYRQRRDSERITEHQLQWILFLAYQAGRDDFADKVPSPCLRDLYARVADRALDVEFAASILSE